MCSEKNSSTRRAGFSRAGTTASRSWWKTQVSSGTPLTMPAWCEANWATPRAFSQVAIGTDCFQCVEAAAVAEVGLLLQQAVGDDLVARGGRDDELAGGLVVGVVDRRQPPAGLVGPVVAEERPLAVPVLADPQAGGWDSAIGHRERPALARLRRRVEGDAEPVVLVL